MQGVACVLMKRWSFGTTACFLLTVVGGDGDRD